MRRRIVIIGGPRTGKSTLSERLQSELGIATLHNSADLESLFPVDRPESWSQQSEHASKWFDEDGDWICEGVQMARALRKWLKANPGKPLDAHLFLLRQPMVPQRDGQKSMMKGVESVFREIEAELIRRGARIQKLKDPESAIEILKSASPTIPNAEGETTMQLELTKEQFDAMPEGLRKLCVEKDGKYTFSADSPDEVSGLKTALAKKTEGEKTAKAERDELLAKYKDIDPEKYAQFVAEAESKENDELKRKGMVDEIIAKSKERENKINQDWQKKYDDVVAENRSLKMDHRLNKAFEEGGAIPDRIDEAITFLKAKGRVKLTDKDEIQVYDANGSPIDASLETFAKELFKNEKAHYYVSATVAGTGALPNGNLSPPGVDLSKLPPTERLKYANRQEAK